MKEKAGKGIGSDEGKEEERKLKIKYWLVQGIE